MKKQEFLKRLDDLCGYLSEVDKQSSTQDTLLFVNTLENRNILTERQSDKLRKKYKLTVGKRV